MIVSLPGVERGAATVLNEVLQSAPQHVLLIFQKSDGTWESDCSHMQIGFMCHALATLQEDVRKKLFP